MPLLTLVRVCPFALVEAAAVVVLRFFLGDYAVAAAFSRCRCCLSSHLLLLCQWAVWVARPGDMVVLMYLLLESIGHAWIQTSTGYSNKHSTLLVGRFREKLMFVPAHRVATTAVSAPPMYLLLQLCWWAAVVQQAMFCTRVWWSPPESTALLTDNITTRSVLFVRCPCYHCCCRSAAFFSPCCYCGDCL